MLVNYTVRKTNVGDMFKQRAQRKLDKFDRFFDKATAHITVSQEKDRFTVEVTINTSDMVYRSERTSMEIIEALDSTINAIFRQISKNKTKLERKLRDDAFSDSSAFKSLLENDNEFEEIEEEFKIVRNKRFFVKPATIEEAILQMNMLDHEFFLFRNDESGEINVVYKRKDGDYGLIEPTN